MFIQYEILPFVREIHRSSVDSPCKAPVMRHHDAHMTSPLWHFQLWKPVWYMQVQASKPISWTTPWYYKHNRWVVKPSYLYSGNLCVYKTVFYIETTSWAPIKCLIDKPYRKTLRCLEPARLSIIMIMPLRVLTGTSAAVFGRRTVTSLI